MMQAEMGTWPMVQAEMGTADHLWHLERSAISKYNKTELKNIGFQQIIENVFVC